MAVGLPGPTQWGPGGSRAGIRVSGSWAEKVLIASAGSEAGRRCCPVPRDGHGEALPAGLSLLSHLLLFPVESAEA